MTENPYESPISELIDIAPPFAFINSGLTVEKLRLTAWVAMAHFLLGILFTTVAICSAFSHSQALSWLSTVLVVVNTVAWIYVIWVFQRFAEARVNASGLRPYVMALISLSILIIALGHWMQMETQAHSPGWATGLYFLAMILYGICNALYGRRLLKAPLPYPRLRAYAWLNVAIGICMALVLLFPLAILMDLAVGLLESLLLFQGAHELRNLAAPERA